MTKYSMVIRGGSVVDGTGRPERTADIAIAGGVIAEVGRVDGAGQREIDAHGAMVTPGWVDIHTHYDAQATWESQLAPSSWLGVTSTVMGNCGVGFAPVRDSDHDSLIELMEGVEDIPGTALHEGLEWGWNSFGEYLDALDRIPHDIDFGVYVPHNPLRLFVMGDRGAAGEPATDQDIAAMGRLARISIEQGALGFSSSRLEIHRTSKGDPTPSFGAEAKECIGIASALGGIPRRGGDSAGALQIATDFYDLDGEFAMLRAMAEASGMPLSFALTYRHDDEEARLLRAVLARTEDANERGLAIVGQVSPRGIGVLYGLGCTLNPFSTNPVFGEIAHLTAAQKAQIMRDPGFRQRLMENLTSDVEFRPGGRWLNLWHGMYEMGDPPNYEPRPNESIAARAEAENRAPEEVAYDTLLKDDGDAMLYIPSNNYRDGNLDVVREMLAHRLTLPGLSDGGAHVGTICDASTPTTLLEYWARDRPSARFDVPYVVKKQCADTARFVGLSDRGVLAPGYRADINVIDFQNLRVRRPVFHADLPAGGRRLMQRADGYLYSIVRGQTVYESGAATGALPGRLIRGRRPTPAAA
jgi:N-acyl-D-aspartate/D-glutamate deacylase